MKGQWERRSWIPGALGEEGFRDTPHLYRHLGTGSDGPGAESVRCPPSVGRGWRCRSCWQKSRRAQGTRSLSLLRSVAEPQPDLSISLWSCPGALHPSPAPRLLPCAAPDTAFTGECGLQVPGLWAVQGQFRGWVTAVQECVSLWPVWCGRGQGAVPEENQSLWAVGPDRPPLQSHLWSAGERI